MLYGYLTLYGLSFAANCILLLLKERLEALRLFLAPLRRRLAELVAPALVLLIFSFVVPRHAGGSPCGGGGMARALAVVLGVWVAAVFLLRDALCRPSVRAAVDLAAAAAAVWCGARITFISLGDGYYFPAEGASLLISIAWIFLNVQVMRATNFVPGLVSGAASILSWLLLGALFSQRSVPAAAVSFAVVLSASLTASWLMNYWKEPRRLAPPAVGVWGGFLAVASIWGTSKRVLVLSAVTPLLLLVLPLVFFSLLIGVSYLRPRVSRSVKAGEGRIVYAWSLSVKRVVNVILLFCVIGNLLILSHLYLGRWPWTVGAAVISIAVYMQAAAFMLIRARRFESPEDASRDVSPRGGRGGRSRAPRFVSVLGLVFPVGSAEQTWGKVKRLLQRGLEGPPGRCAVVATPDSLAMVRSLRDSDYRAVLERADLLLPDGAGIVWASDFLHERALLTRAPGIETVERLCAHCERTGLSVYLLGSRREVLDAAVEVLRRRHPNLRIAGTHHGYFSPDEEAAVVESIASSGASVLFVAMGVPRQELFIARNIGRLGDVKLAMGVGGSFDVISESLSRAPLFLRSLGLEWLWRVLIEPSRLGRVLLLPVFVHHVVLEKLRAGGWPLDDDEAAAAEGGAAMRSSGGSGAGRAAGGSDAGRAHEVEGAGGGRCRTPDCGGGGR